MAKEKWRMYKDMVKMKPNKWGDMKNMTIARQKPAMSADTATEKKTDRG